METYTRVSAVHKEIVMRKRNVVFLGLSLSIGPWALAATSVIGIVVGQTWTKADSPYVLVGDVMFTSGTIQPGVEIQAGGNYTFEIGGIVTIQGTKVEPILFTTAPGVEAWQGVLCNRTPGTLELSWVIIERAQASGLHIVDCAATVRNSIFRDNVSAAGAGVRIEVTTTATLDDIVFEDCTIAGNTASRSDGGSAFGGGLYSGNQRSRTILSRCLITENACTVGATGDRYACGGGVYVFEGRIILVGCQVTHNMCSGAYPEGGALYCVSNGDADLQNCTLADNALNGYRTYGAAVLTGGTLQIKDCCIMRNGAYASYSYNGVISIWGGACTIVN